MLEGVSKSRQWSRAPVPRRITEPGSGTEVAMNPSMPSTVLMVAGDLPKVVDAPAIVSVLPGTSSIVKFASALRANAMGARWSDGGATISPASLTPVAFVEVRRVERREDAVEAAPQKLHEVRPSR